MAVFAALLKGVNVGGKNRIKMDDLRRLMISVGLADVQTYIQSGNILFKSDEEEYALRQKIDLGINTAFGLNIPVILRTADELESSLANFPFLAVNRPNSTPETETQYIAFLSHAPLPDAVAKLNEYINENDRFTIAGRNVYLLLRDGVRKSKLAAHIQILDSAATLRNVKTLAALVSLAKAMRE